MEAQLYYFIPLQTAHSEAGSSFHTMRLRGRTSTSSHVTAIQGSKMYRRNSQELTPFFTAFYVICFAIIFITSSLDCVRIGYIWSHPSGLPRIVAFGEPRLIKEHSSPRQDPGTRLSYFYHQILDLSFLSSCFRSPSRCHRNAG